MEKSLDYVITDAMGEEIKELIGHRPMFKIENNTLSIDDDLIHHPFQRIVEHSVKFTNEPWSREYHHVVKVDELSKKVISIEPYQSCWEDAPFYLFSNYWNHRMKLDKENRDLKKTVEYTSIFLRSSLVKLIRVIVNGIGLEDENDIHASYRQPSCGGAFSVSVIKVPMTSQYKVYVRSPLTKYPMSFAATTEFMFDRDKNALVCGKLIQDVSIWKPSMMYEIIKNGHRDYTVQTCGVDIAYVKGYDLGNEKDYITAVNKINEINDGRSDDKLMNVLLHRRFEPVQIIKN